MSGIWSLLWPINKSSGPSVAIPTYLQGEAEDTIDLQIKSLIYMFRRCDVSNLRPYGEEAEYVGRATKTGSAAWPDNKEDDNINNNNNDILPRKLAHKRSQILTKSTWNEPGGQIFEKDDHNYTTIAARSPSVASKGSLNDVSITEMKKLDIIYNKREFERILYQDEHRIIIDWAKNKFRSLCILSAPPRELDQLPTLGESSSHFQFLILRPEADDETYIDTLSQSDIYIEHDIAMTTRRKLVSGILAQMRSKTEERQQQQQSQFTSADRVYIIKTYLHKLAFEVQVSRLYRGLLQDRLRHANYLKSNNTPILSPTAQPPPLFTLPSITPLSSSPIHSNSPAITGSVFPAVATRTLRHTKSLASLTPTVGGLSLSNESAIPGVVVGVKAGGPSSADNRTTNIRTPGGGRVNIPIVNYQNHHNNHNHNHAAPGAPRVGSPTRGNMVPIMSPPPSSPVRARGGSIKPLIPLSVGRNPMNGTTPTTPVTPVNVTTNTNTINNAEPDELSRDLLAQAKIAVRSRLEREKSVIASGY